MLHLLFDMLEGASRETTSNFDVGRDRCVMKLFSRCLPSMKSLHSILGISRHGKSRRRISPETALSMKHKGVEVVVEGWIDSVYCSLSPLILEWSLLWTSHKSTSTRTDHQAVAGKRVKLSTGISSFVRVEEQQFGNVDQSEGEGEGVEKHCIDSMINEMRYVQSVSMIPDGVEHQNNQHLIIKVTYQSIVSLIAWTMNVNRSSMNHPGPACYIQIPFFVVVYVKIEVNLFGKWRKNVHD